MIITQEKSPFTEKIYFDEEIGIESKFFQTRKSDEKKEHRKLQSMWFLYPVEMSKA